MCDSLPSSHCREIPRLLPVLSQALPEGSGRLHRPRIPPDKLRQLWISSVS